MGVTKVFLEAREKGQRKKDLQLVNALRSRRTIWDELRVEIGFPSEEPMLWIPDQVLGALGDAETRRLTTPDGSTSTEDASSGSASRCRQREGQVPSVRGPWPLLPCSLRESADTS